MAQGSRCFRAQLHHSQRTVRLGLVSCRGRHPRAVRRTARGTGCARHPDQRKPPRLWTRCASQVLRPTRQGRALAERRLSRAGPDCQQAQEIPPAELSLAATGKICRAIRCDRRHQHFADVRALRSDPRPGKHSRRLPAGMQFSAADHRDAAARNPHRYSGGGASSRFLARQTRCGASISYRTSLACR